MRGHRVHGSGFRFCLYITRTPYPQLKMTVLCLLRSGYARSCFLSHPLLQALHKALGHRVLVPQAARYRSLGLGLWGFRASALRVANLHAEARDLQHHSTNACRAFSGPLHESFSVVGCINPGV